MGNENEPSIYPDWKREEDYEDLKSLSPDQWAWEFLKRNPAYIEEWKRLTQGWTDEEKQVKRHFLSAEKWGLLSYLDPSSRIRYCNIQFIPPGGEEKILTTSDLPHTKGMRVLMASSETTGEVLYRFDTRYPIIPQLHHAKKRLLALQRAQKRGKKRKIFKPRRDDWILLVRILDAVAAGAADKEIARALTPTTSEDDYSDLKKLYDKKQQALRYAASDYRLIPSSDQ